MNVNRISGSLRKPVTLKKFVRPDLDSEMPHSEEVEDVPSNFDDIIKYEGKRKAVAKQAVAGKHMADDEQKGKSIRTVKTKGKYFRLTQDQVLNREIRLNTRGYKKQDEIDKTRAKQLLWNPVADIGEFGYDGSHAGLEDAGDSSYKEPADSRLVKPTEPFAQLQRLRGTTLRKLK